MCVFRHVCVLGGDLQGLITPRWILITVWWDTQHQSQSTNALAVNHFNEYILFWPFLRLFCVFHITVPFPHYSFSLLALLNIHTQTFQLFLISHPSWSFFLTNAFFFLVSLSYAILFLLQSKSTIIRQTRSCCAGTQSAQRFRVLCGNMKIRLGSCRCQATALAASAPSCRCPSALMQQGITPASCSWKTARAYGQLKLSQCPQQVRCNFGKMVYVLLCDVLFFLDQGYYFRITESWRTSCQICRDNEPWV